VYWTLTRDPTRPGPKCWPGDPVTRDPDDPVPSLVPILSERFYIYAPGCASDVDVSLQR